MIFCHSMSAVWVLSALIRGGDPRCYDWICLGTLKHLPGRYLCSNEPPSGTFTTKYLDNYRLQRSWGKVIFLHLSMIHHRSHDQGGLCPAGVSVQGVLCWGRSLFRGDLCQGEVSVQRGLCLGEGGLCPGGVSVQGIYVQGGLCPGRPPPYDNERAVRTLLECFLVLQRFRHR